MSRRCEVCSALGRSTTGRSRRLDIAERILTLCQFHARALRKDPPADSTELRARFREEDGRRSLVGRREAFDRRAFPPRPEGRRRGGGRRRADTR